MVESRSIGPQSEIQDFPRARAMTSLGEILSSKVRATLLAWIVPRLDARFSLTELSHEVGAPISSLQHECYKLERIGVLKGRREGVSRRYQVQLDHALSRPLINLVIATLGVETVLRDAVADAGDIDLAVIAGPLPHTGDNRLELVLIGEVNLAGLDRTQRRVSMLLGIEPDGIDLAYFRPDDWFAYGETGHPLLGRLAGRPIQPITGDWPTATFL